jgi:cytochrome c2
MAFKAFRARASVASVVAVVSMLLVSYPSLAESPQELYQARCAGCHSIGGGRLVGPDLAGLSDRRTEDWVVSFVQDSAALIASGDAQAKEVFEAYNKMPMPPQALSAEQIVGILGLTSKVVAEPNPPQEVPEDTVQEPAELGAVETAADEPVAGGELPPVPEAGAHLFEGRKRFENGGPACVACHSISVDGVHGGGSLAVDLTEVYGKMGGGAGIKAIVSNAPFPVMNRAYKDRPLTEEELGELVTFFEVANARSADAPENHTKGIFVSTAVFGAGALFGLYSFLWRKRKQTSVNKSVYDRQLKSR